jgi:hypothetical protein
MRWKLSRRFLVGSCEIIVLLAFGINVTEAAATVVPLKIDRGIFMVVTLPQLDDGLESRYLSKFNETYRNNVLQPYRQFEFVALETRRAPLLPTQVKNAMTFQAGYDVFRNDDRIVSIMQKLYQFTGGAHGMSHVMTSTIDLQAGCELKLADLFTTDKDYLGKLNEAVRQANVTRKYPAWGFKGIHPDSLYYLSDEGIVLIFQPYEIAPYSEGIVKILVTYQDVADILRAEYTPSRHD